MSTIKDIAKLLEANCVAGDIRSHSEFVKMQYDNISRSATSLGYSDNVANAVMGYVLNHHYFDIDSYEKLQIVLGVVFEMLCPLAEDDERSQIYLNLLAERLKGNNQ
jgi:hypothetical protein